MKSYNATNFKGRLYSYALDTIDTEKGEAIAGTITLEVNEDGTTVDIRYFAYPTYSSGKKNTTYDILAAIMDGEYATVVDEGEGADWLASTGSIDVSYFVGTRSGDDDLQRAQKVRGNFINPNKNKVYENNWKLDYLITRITEIEADQERDYPRYAKVFGFYIDSYNKRVLEAAFQVRNPAGVDFVVGLDVSLDSPYFVSCSGKLTRSVNTKVTKSSFGEDQVVEFTNTSWTLESMAADPYEFGDERVLTIDEYNEFRANLEAFQEAAREKGGKDSGAGKPKKEISF